MKDLGTYHSNNVAMVVFAGPNLIFCLYFKLFFGARAGFSLQSFC